jgi:nitrite reductase/ring-hydroxylating ferredoxin subunit
MTDQTEGWVFAARADEVESDVATLVVAGSVEIALCRVGDEFFALDNICSHEYACLSDGWVEGDEIECPLHQARFHIPTGQVLAPPATEDLKTYPVRRVGDDVYVQVGAV